MKRVFIAFFVAFGFASGLSTHHESLFLPHSSLSFLPILLCVFVVLRDEPLPLRSPSSLPSSVKRKQAHLIHFQTTR